MTDYTVGYRRPPIHTRFKPGKSGNPKGKPKGQKKLATIISDVLKEMVSIREGDTVRKVCRAEAMVRAVSVKAMKGDSKALMTFLSLCQQSGEFEPEPERIEAIHRYLITPDGKQYSLPSAAKQDLEKYPPYDGSISWNQDRSGK